MKINGNLQFNNITTDSLLNVKIESAAMGNPLNPEYSGSGTNAAGRILYNTDTNSYAFHTGSAWVAFATGGDASSLQAEVDAIELASGNVFGSDGTWSATPLSGTAFISGATDLADALTLLDAAANGANELAELNDVDVTGAVTNQVLQYNGTKWVDHTLVLTDISDVAATATEVDYLQNTDSNIEQHFTDVETALASTDANVADVLTILGAADGNTSLTYATVNYVTQNATVEVAIGELDSALANVAADLAATNLGDLADVTDAQTGSLDSANSAAYFFTANTASSYDVTPATLGSLNNVASGVDASNNDDILAFDGTEWTAVTPATFLGETSIDDLGDVTITSNTSGDVLYFNGTAWVNAAPGSTSGVQAWDAGLDALAAFNTNGILVQTANNTFVGRSLANTAGHLTLVNADGVAGNPTLGLPNVGTSVSDSFVRITTDAQGRVSGTSAVETADITALVDATYVNVSGDTMTGNLTMDANAAVILPSAPSADTHATNKAYVDARVAGLTWKNSVRATSNTNLTLSGEQTIDGVSVVSGDRVLVKSQTAPAENGIYVVASGSWTRATDMDSLTPTDEINGAAVFVEEGSTYADTGWVVTSQVATLGTSAMTWTQFNGASGITAGVGLSKDGNTLNVNLGAGIAALPTDEVGIEVESAKAVQLTSTATDGLLTFVIDTTDVLSQSANGIALVANSITGTYISDLAAGAALSLSGDAFAVNVDNVSIEINADALRVKDGGISNAMLAANSFSTNSSTIELGGSLTFAAGQSLAVADNGTGTITYSANVASTTDLGVASFNSANFTVVAGAVSLTNNTVTNNQLVNSTVTMAGDGGSQAVDLGDTFTITGGNGISTLVSGDEVTITRDDMATSDLTDVSAAGSANGQVMVFNGTSYVPRQIHHVETVAAANTTWSVSHNLSQQFVNVTVVDANNEVIIPNSITMTDSNTTTITFNTAVAGKAIITGVAGV